MLSFFVIEWVRDKRRRRVGGHWLRFECWKMSGFLIEFTMVSFPKVSHTATYTLNTETHTHTHALWYTHSTYTHTEGCGKWASLIEKNQAERNLIAAVWPEGGGKKREVSNRKGWDEETARDKEIETNWVRYKCHDVMARLLPFIYLFIFYDRFRLHHWNFVTLWHY